MSRRQLSLDGVPNRVELLREAGRLGCVVEPVRRTGEVRVLPPDGGPPLMLNNRRKEGTRVLVLLLRRLRGER